MAPRERSGVEQALADLVGSDVWSRVFDQLTWADEEVEAARLRHARTRSRLGSEEVHNLLRPTFELMHIEGTYRGHCRELLDRVVAGQDTEPGTAAEMCCVFAEFTPHNMITRGAQLVYHRAFDFVYPGKLPENADLIKSLEYGDSHEANQLEKSLRRKLTVKGRKLPYRPANWKETPLPELVDSVLVDVEGAA